MRTPGSSAPLPWSLRIAYASPALALAVVGIPIYVHLPKFYSDVVGVGVGTLGLILLAARLFDAVADPLMGWVSDHTRTGFGRRRPWILLGSVPLGIALLYLFTPAIGTELDGAWRFALGIFAVFLFWTVVTVPYEALGVELTSDFDERTAVLGLRDAALLIGTLAAAAAPAVTVTALGLPGDVDVERAKFFWMAALYAPVVVASCTICALTLRELPPRPRATAGAAGWRTLLENRPFRVLLGSYAIGAIGSNLPAALLLYYVQYVLRSDAADLFLALYLATGVALLPAWVALSRRVGKRRAWILSMAINTGAFLGVFFLGPGDTVAYGVLVTLSGLGLGATLALPSSLQADVIDYDELLSGSRREGLYVGVWSVTRKASAAIGVGVALPLLGLAGYVPNQPQSAQVVIALRSLYALVPCLCNLAAIAVALSYPIGREQHADILAAIADRRRGLSVRDPLRPGVVLEPA